MKIPKKTPFWERVKTELRAQKISQKELAALVKMNYNTLKFWLCYGYYPDVETACDISRVLGVSVEYLTKGINTRPTKKYDKRIIKIKKSASVIKKLARQIEGIHFNQGKAGVP